MQVGPSLSSDLVYWNDHLYDVDNNPSLPKELVFSSSRNVFDARKEGKKYSIIRDLTTFVHEESTFFLLVRCCLEGDEVIFGETEEEDEVKEGEEKRGEYCK